MSPANLTPRETAERLRISPKTLANWRVLGKGPRYIKVGSHVRYPDQELTYYERSNLKGTAE